MYALQASLIVTSLDLQCNQLDDIAASTITSALKNNTSLKIVELTDNQITEIDARSFAKILLINRTLFDLNLSLNAIGDLGIVCIFCALQNNDTLQSLHLNRRAVTNKGVQELALNRQLKTNLRVLYFNENNLGDEGIIVISRFVVRYTRLNGFHLTTNKITSVGAETIAVLFRQADCSLTELDLSGNQLTDKGSSNMFNISNIHQTLRYLYLSDNPLTKSKDSTLSDDMMDRQSLGTV